MTKILVVDDIEVNRLLLNDLLESHNYEVSLAEQGDQALAMVKDDPPDLIISDILMPVMDGFALCRSLKANEHLSHIPFIFYTATYTSRKEKAFAYELGADRYLVKPDDFDVIFHAIEEVLAEYRQRESKPPNKPIENTDGLNEKYSQILSHRLDDKMQQIQRLKWILEVNGQSESWGRTPKDNLSLSEDKLTGGPNDAGTIQDFGTYRLLEELHHTLIEQSFQGVTIFGDDGIAFANPAFGEMVGHDVSDLMSMNVSQAWDLIHPHDLPVVQERFFDDSDEEAVAHRQRIRLLHASGKWIWSEIVITQINYQDQSAVLIAFVNVTRQIEAEEQLLLQDQILEERVQDRTAELKNMVDLMVGREVRMAELKRVIKKLRNQLIEAGIEPSADDPLYSDQESEWKPI